MSVNWTTEKTFQFIELYRNASLIWNPKNKFHKHKIRVSEAWERISETMSIPVTELKRKKEILLAAYRLNCRKVQASIIPGAEEDDILKPVWIYYDALNAFMADVYKGGNVLTIEEEEIFQQSQSSLNDGDPLLNEDSSADENQYLILEDNKSVQRPVETPVHKRRRCQKLVELAEIQTQMNTALTTLNKVLNHPKEIKPENECDLYGRLLAQKLKSYSAMERQELMYEIDGLLLEKWRSTGMVSSSFRKTEA